MIAIDASGGQIAQPADLVRPRAEDFAVARQNRIPRFAGRGRDNDVGDAVEIAAVERTELQTPVTMRLDFSEAMITPARGADRPTFG
jgi:hypothetical protein